MFDFEDEALENYMLTLLEGDDLNLNKDGTETYKNPIDYAMFYKGKKTVEGNKTRVVSDKIRMLCSIFANVMEHPYNKLVEPFVTYPNFCKDIMLPAIRHTFPHLIAHELFGVQVLPSEKEKIHTLRVIYKTEQDVQDVIKALESKEFGLDPNLPKNIDKPAILEATKEGVGRLSIQVLKEEVETTETKLSALWSSLNKVKQEDLIEMIAGLCISEIDEEHLRVVSDCMGEPTSIFDQMQISGTTFVGDVHAALAILIIRQANLIAARTRRGAGNWCVVSPTALTILQSATTSAFARVNADHFDVDITKGFNKGIMYIGTLNNAMKVYCNPYSSDETPVLVGYRGNHIDAGAFYTPFQPLMIDNDSSFIDNKTKEIGIGFKRKDGFHLLENASSSLGNAADYFGKVGINTASLSFI